MFAFLTVLSLPLKAAHEHSDTVFTFRFLSNNDAFYGSIFGNDAELSQLEECVASCRSGILSGNVLLYVDGFCDSAKDEAAKLRIAATRSNRIKSELIVRDGLKEEHFITHNHDEKGDLVSVRLIVPKTAGPLDSAAAIKEAVMNPTTIEEQKQIPVVEVTSQTESKGSTVITEAPMASTAGGHRTHFFVRANLLRWVTLTPDIGLEWRINRNVGIVVNGLWTTWSWNDKGHRYALREIMPEIRWYFGNNFRGYVGAMYKTGAFNYKFSKVGKQGNINGGGLIGGYCLPLNRVLSLDFSIAMGYLRVNYDKYNVIDGVRVRAGKERKNWFGPINAGVTLTWTIF